MQLKRCESNIGLNSYFPHNLFFRRRSGLNRIKEDAQGYETIRCSVGTGGNSSVFKDDQM